MNLLFKTISIVALAGMPAGAVFAATVAVTDPSVPDGEPLHSLESGALHSGSHADGEGGDSAHGTHGIAGLLAHQPPHHHAMSDDPPDLVLADLRHSAGTGLCDNGACGGLGRDGGALSELSPVPAPLPPAAALMGAAFLGLGALSLRRRRRRA